MKLPRYDKSAYNGRGDRADPSTWPEVEGPLTVVLFEEWMLGFKPTPAATVKAVDPQVLQVLSKVCQVYLKDPEFSDVEWMKVGTQTAIALGLRIFENTKYLSHERAVWLRDLNYQLVLSYHETRNLLEQNDWDPLLNKDQE